MGALNINIGQLAVSSGHLKAGVSKHLLQAEDIAAVAQELGCCCMAQGVRGAADSLQFRLPPIALRDFLHPILRQWSALFSEEEKIGVGPCWLGSAAVNIMPEAALNALTYGNKTLLIPLTKSLEHALLQPQVA